VLALNPMHSPSGSRLSFVSCLSRGLASANGTLFALVASKTLPTPYPAILTFHQAWQTVKADFQIIFDRDPAARNGLEVLCCYPGFHALLLHRVAHWLHRHQVAFIPRLISYLGRFFTGIEIHPGAVMGRGVFIDHGMGVVIGETAVVGDYTLIYQGVTLGGTGKESGKRHPTLGQHVVVGAGAKILGNISIGDYARVGAGSIVLRDVPARCTAVGVPGRNICRTNIQDCPLEHGQIPDAEAIAIRTLLNRIEQLESQVLMLNDILATRI
jgi:serine O-acetyltransferase